MSSSAAALLLDNPVRSDATVVGATRAGWSYVAQIAWAGGYHVSVQLLDANGARKGEIARAGVSFPTEMMARAHAQALAMELTPLSF